MRAMDASMRGPPPPGQPAVVNEDMGAGVGHARGHAACFCRTFRCCTRGLAGSALPDISWDCPWE